MAVTITSRAFDQDAAGAKRAANRGLVFITDRLLGRAGSIADLLATPGADAVALPSIRHGEAPQAADLA
ncbi:MAG: type II toxin-antitoxin system Phd/YefM family antitoxin [Cyanobacteria bacterium K_Offshore_surface_m2_239]|nr:type II toxin-antitoxin system Phd/YefM family antitoxin [Cyanobacteria bacterium K_Offshore_surface_m2_239]